MTLINFSYFFSLSESEPPDEISFSSDDILFLRYTLELSNEKFFLSSSDMVLSYFSETSDKTFSYFSEAPNLATKSFSRILCLVRRELCFSIISNKQALSSGYEKGECTSSSSSESDSASDEYFPSDSSSVLAISAKATCSSSESSSSDSESSPVVTSPFFPL